MGVWKSARGHVSDNVVDILGDAINKIKDCWYGTTPDNKQKFSMIDLADAIEFVSNGILVVEINPDAEHLRYLEVDQVDPKIPKNKKTDVGYINKKLLEHEKKTGVRTFINRGQTHPDHFPTHRL
jgi:hypothetical protein